MPHGTATYDQRFSEGKLYESVDFRCTDEPRKLALYREYCQKHKLKIKVTKFREKEVIIFVRNEEGHQVGTGQPATSPEMKSEGGYKPQPEADGRSQRVPGF